jgi:hypothetical protein
MKAAGSGTSRIETPFQLEGMNGMGLAGVELHGLMGYTVLAKYKMHFDYTKQQMAWTPLKFDPPPPFPLTGKDLLERGHTEAFAAVIRYIKNVIGRERNIGSLAFHDFIERHGDFVLGAGASKACLGTGTRTRAPLTRSPRPLRLDSERSGAPGQLTGAPRLSPRCLRRWNRAFESIPNELGPNHGRQRREAVPT